MASYSMEIKLHEIPIREVVAGYADNAEEWVVGYGGRLNIRPPYQREFVYQWKQRDEVINTVRKKFPLNVMYWAKNPDWNFEVLDGQQRTLSICQYVNGDYSINGNYFHSLTEDQQKDILDYKLMIYICEWEESEKLDWFRIVNIAWEKLTDQELRNSVYTGPRLADAKRHFSKTACPAYQIGSKYLKGSSIRQEYLETALKRISQGNIEEYMSKNQFNENASELWQHFQSVINWINVIFPTYRKEMSGLDWGTWYNEYKNHSFDSQKLEQQVKDLMEDDEVEKKSGIYPYLLTGDEKYLNLRAFPDSIKRQIYEKQNWICPHCKEHFEINQMEADHITPRSQGGKTEVSNCQMLCRECNRRKSNN